MIDVVLCDCLFCGLYVWFEDGVGCYFDVEFGFFCFFQELVGFFVIYVDWFFGLDVFVCCEDCF